MTYQVTIEPSGHTFEVEEDELILEAALRQDIGFPHGCKNGACGTCLGNVISGEIDYPDGRPITIMEHEHEQGKAIFCVSVAKSDLTLEVKEVDNSDEIKIQLLPARVSLLRKLSSDVMEMTLKIPEGKLFAFRAGQYIEFILRDKSRRAFSVASSPSNEKELELHLRHIEGGKFTSHVFDEMKEKAIVRFEGPFGSFFIQDDSERPLILVAGGTGFAPIKSMLLQLAEQGDDRPTHVYWGVRSKADLYNHDFMKKWAFHHPHINYIPVLSEAKEDEGWDGREGFVHTAVLEDFTDLSGFDVYMAGPPPMINAAKETFIKQGLSDDQLFSDSFEYAVQN